MFGAEVTDPDIFAGNIKTTFWADTKGLEFFNNLGIEMLETVMFVQLGSAGHSEGTFVATVHRYEGNSHISPIAPL